MGGAYIYGLNGWGSYDKVIKLLGKCLDDPLGYIPDISITTMQPRNSPGGHGYVGLKKEPHQINVKGDIALQKKEASQVHPDSNCNHSLNFTCHTHKRNATRR